MARIIERTKVLRLRTRARRWMTSLIVVVVTSFAAAQALTIGVIVPPSDLDDVSDAGVLASAVVRGALQGAEMAEEEQAFNAEMFGLDFSVEVRRVAGADEVVQAAQALVDEAGATAVAGGFGYDDAVALSGWSARSGVPFLNVGASEDALRHELCEATTLHVAPSAAMYLDALVGWYVRSAFRAWYLVLGDGLDAEALADRTRWSMQERHFGAREVGRAEIGRGDDVTDLAGAIQRSGADVVLLLMDAEHQLEVLAALEEAGLDVAVAGFPTGEAQTRTFFDLSRRAAPTLGSDHRATAWEATLDAYGARELNARFRDRFGEPMEPSAWATYVAVKIAFEAATLGGSPDPEDMLAHMTGQQGVFDVWKGIGVTFRPWDRQLRQSLYLVKISPDAEQPLAYAGLVGELPAIYMPGTDPEERLDQLGDLRPRSRCAP